MRLFTTATRIRSTTTASALTGSPHDAADATQDAFVNVLGRLQQDDRPVLDFASYLFAAARNESYALMRKRSRTQPTDDVPDRAASQPNLETDPEPAVLLRDSQETVRRANAKLPPRYREVLALREVAGRSYGEIGQIMGISENAAAQLIFRARGKLKDALTAGAVASVVVATDDCERARLLINRLEDGESITTRSRSGSTSTSSTAAPAEPRAGCCSRWARRTAPGPSCR